MKATLHIFRTYYGRTIDRNNLETYCGSKDFENSRAAGHIDTTFRKDQMCKDCEGIRQVLWRLQRGNKHVPRPTAGARILK